MEPQQVEHSDLGNCRSQQVRTLGEHGTDHQTTIGTTTDCQGVWVRQSGIDEVKEKLTELGLALKDSVPGFDPLAAAEAYDEASDDDDYAETEQY